MTAVDFATAGTTHVATPDEVSTFLRDHAAPAVRLGGTCAHQDRVPAPDGAAWLLLLGGLDRIERLDVGDLTCSVQVGVTYAALAATLAEHGVELACEGEGSLGGMFARGELAPLAPGAASARCLLLGLEAVRADGTRFKVGARVVKSVAGFDLHKAFVGSRGRLFAATVLHLKLRARPPARAHFELTDLDADAAVARLRELRAWSTPPTRIVLERAAEGACRVAGTIEGAPAHVEQMVARHGLRRSDIAARFGLVASAEKEVVDGFVLPSRVGAFLRALPVSVAAHVSGTGQFQAISSPGDTDEVFARLRDLDGGAELRAGRAARRGLTTPTDPAVTALEQRVREALDPQGRFR